MSKVLVIEEKNDKNGNPMKVTVFDTGERVYVNSKYDEPIYDSVVVGADFELTKDGNFDKIKYDKPVTRTGGGAGIAKAQETKREDIKTAQERRATGIEVSATFRDATIITTAQFNGQTFTDEEFRVKWSEWRQWLNNNFDPDETKRVLGF